MQPHKVALKRPGTSPSCWKEGEGGESVAPSENNLPPDSDIGRVSFINLPRNGRGRRGVGDAPLFQKVRLGLTARGAKLSTRIPRT